MCTAPARPLPPRPSLLSLQVTLRDLASQFYLSEGDVGKNRAEACRWVPLPAVAGCLHGAPQGRPISAQLPLLWRLGGQCMPCAAVVASKRMLRASACEADALESAAEPSSTLTAGCWEAVQELSAVASPACAQISLVRFAVAAPCWLQGGGAGAEHLGAGGRQQRRPV